MPDSNAATALANALGLEQDGKLDEALDAYNQSIANGIDDILIHSNRGMLLERLKRYPEALDSFQKASAIESNFRDHYNAGNMQLTLGNHAKALESYAASLAHRENYPDCWVNKAIAHHALNQIPDAHAALEKALALDPTFYPALRSQAILLSSTGREREAIAVYQKATEAKPSFSNAWFEYACAIYKSLGDEITFDPSGPEGQAMRALDKVIEIEPNKQGAWGRKIGILFRLVDAAQSADNDTAASSAPRMFPLIHNELLTTIEAAIARFPEDDWFPQRKKDAQAME